MATSFDLFFSGSPDAAKAALGPALEADGFRVSQHPDGNWLLERGNSTKSIWLGAVAGKDFYFSFELQFFSGPEGELIARLNRNVAGGALRGGAIGASRASDQFNQTYASLLERLQPTGILTRTVANG